MERSSEGRIADKTSPYPAAIAEEINRFEHYLKQVCGLRLATAPFGYNVYVLSWSINLPMRVYGSAR